MGWGFRLFKRFFISAEEGAQTSLFLAYDSSVYKKTGGYYVSCSLKTPSAKARNLALEESLWDRSMELFAQVWSEV